MANSTTHSAWQQIQAGVYDTEKLLSGQEYNLAMIKARQTLEIIIKQLSGRDDYDDQSLTDIINSLCENKTISEKSCEHYHKICVISNKAVHENNDDGFNATTAYQLLSEEVQTFIRDYSPKKSKITPVPVRNDNAQRRPVTKSSESAPKRKVAKKTPKKKKSTVNTPDLIKVLIGVVILFILIILFRSLNPLKGGKAAKTKTATTTTVAASEGAESSESSLETTSAQATTTKYITTTKLNVRSSPSKDGDLLATLNVGVSVEYVGAQDANWAIINYNGGQAYVASAYIKPAQ